MDSLETFKLKTMLKELRPLRGKHTEFVSVYVPAGYDLNKRINQLLQEQATATNIKSASTRKNVINALEKMIQQLRLIDKTPENGLAIFSGNVAERDGDMDVKVWYIEPYIPLNLSIYRCDKDFKLEALESMLMTKNVYMLITMDKREATIGVLKGSSVIAMNSMTSAVPGKHKTGGQSAARMERLRDEAAKEFYRRISGYIKEQFKDLSEIKGVLIGGPGFTKNDFVVQGQFNEEFKAKILGIKDLSYTDEYGLSELVDLCSEELSLEEISGEKKILKDFFERMAKDIDSIAYGYDDVKKAIEFNAVDHLMLSEELEDKVIEELDKMGEATGAIVHIISTEFSEGLQFKNVTGIGAILRFPMNFNQ